MRYLILSIVFVLADARFAGAQLPAAPSSGSIWSNWSMTLTPDQPGELSADSLLDKPAARNGPIVIRNGHFYSGDSRVRFWGVNLAFSANFPTHSQADELAVRFARYGINAVRFHHMDNQPFPNGIFADSSLTTLSPVALERLDYFLTTLKRQGIYADLNLHVSRNYNHYHKTPDGQDGPRIDKIADLFDPDLIAAQVQYAKDLLGHVNAYTQVRYADEPSVAIVEINNENSMFMWGADHALANLPTVYQNELARQWNRWLIGKYHTREKLKSAWAIGEEVLGKSILADGNFAAAKDGKDTKWLNETAGEAVMKVNFDSTVQADKNPRGAIVDISKIDGTDWHLHLYELLPHLQTGKRYTASFEALVDQPMTIKFAVWQAHSPWASDGLLTTVQLDPQHHWYTYTFTVTQDDDNPRISFLLGLQTGKVIFRNVMLRPGGIGGLNITENPRQNNVKTPSPDAITTPARRQDWYSFLQQTEEKYYLDMMKMLKTDIGVKCPITGTIGFGPLGTLNQSKMDFVDAHAYWEHPSFPHAQWDMNDWRMDNQPMVDHPAQATLWNLAATRVAGKPFTVTEYEHPAPNDWQAECIPFIATYAAMQDWDGIFLFAYSHNSDYAKDHITSFFDIEGNPAKMPLTPIGARLFNTIKPADEDNRRVIAITPQQALEAVPRFSLNPADFLHEIAGVDLKDSPEIPTAISFVGAKQSPRVSEHRLKWTAGAPGTGRFIFADSNADVFIGFATGAMPVEFGVSKARIESLDTPFATITITPAGEKRTLVNGDKLLITAIGRAQNTNMGWNADRTSVGSNWGTAPTQIEVIRAVISLPGRWNRAFALDADGKPTGSDLATVHGDRTQMQLGATPAIAYVISRGGQ
jgi:hypothetical protein